MSKPRFTSAAIIIVLASLLTTFGIVFLAKHHKAVETTTPIPAAAVQSVSLGDYTGPPGQLAEVPVITVAGGKVTQPPSTYLVKPGTILRLKIKSDGDGQLAFVTSTTTVATGSIRTGDNTVDIKFGGDKTYTVTFEGSQASQLTLGIIIPKPSP
jgi:hypothetical protein